MSSRAVTPNDEVTLKPTPAVTTPALSPTLALNVAATPRWIYKSKVAGPGLDVKPIELIPHNWEL